MFATVESYILYALKYNTARYILRVHGENTIDAVVNIKIYSEYLRGSGIIGEISQYK